MPKKLTTEEFIQRAKTVHGDKYGYEKAEYVNVGTAVIISCPEHGDFKQVPKHHLKGYGCAHCVDTPKTAGRDFFRTARAIHGDRYSYHKADYVNISKNIVLTCSIHGDFSQKASQHLNGSGCPLCSPPKNFKSKKFIELAESRHRKKYTYEAVKYKNPTEKVIISCPEHGPFIQSPLRHLKGKGCQQCDLDRIRRAFDELSFDTKQKLTKVLKEHGYPLETFESLIQEMTEGDEKKTFLDKPNCVYFDRNPLSDPVLHLADLTSPKSPCFQVVFDQKKILNEYVIALFKSQKGQDILSSVTTGVAVPSINMDLLKQALLPVPASLEEQQELIDADPIRKLVGEKMKQLERELKSFPSKLSPEMKKIGDAIRLPSKADEIKDLILQGESFNLEFKSTFSFDSDNPERKTPHLEVAVLKNVVAFLNSSGGKLLVGINDEGSIIGIKDELEALHKGSEDKFLQYFGNVLKKRVGAKLYSRIEFELIAIDQKTVFVIACAAPAYFTPAFLDDADFYVRMGSSAHKLMGSDVSDYILENDRSQRS